MSSSTAAVERHEPEKRKPARKRVGGARKLDKRIEPKPDGRYLIYYRPSSAKGPGAVDRRSRSTRMDL